MRSTKEKKLTGGRDNTEEKGLGQIGENAEDKAKSKNEVIMPILPGDRQLIKRTDDQGSVSYTSVEGVEIETYSEELDIIIACMFERLEKLRDIFFQDDDDFALKDLFSSFIYREKLRFDEMFVFISRNIGTIECIMHDNALCRAERIVDAHLIPPTHILEE